MARFVDSERGRRKLVYNGFGYVQNRLGTNHVRWVCDRRHTDKCKAHIKTTLDVYEGDEAVQEVGQHSHASDPSKFEIMSMRYTLKRKATESDSSPSALCSEVLNEWRSEPVAPADLPRVETIKRNIRRFRKMKSGEGSAPSSQHVSFEQFLANRDLDRMDDRADQYLEAQADESAVAVQSLDGPANTSTPAIPTRVTDSAITKLLGQRHVMVNGSLRPIRTLSSTPRILQPLRRCSIMPAANSNGRVPVAVVRGPRAIPLEQGPSKAVMLALSEALNMCKKKSRWESFGEYIGKTLESMPEENARRISLEFQQIINREQEETWANNTNE